MRVVLLPLGGDRENSSKILGERFPKAEIVTLARSELEGVGIKARLAALRKLRPEVFAVSSERLALQRGQNELMLFGALAGATQGLLLDMHGASREESGKSILLRAPARLAREAAASATAVTKSLLHLSEIERKVAGSFSSTAKARRCDFDNSLHITYLRATPGAGTHYGGASTHINGFVNAANALGARITVVSNDHIAGLDEDRFPIKIIEPDPLGTTRSAFDLRNNLIFTRGALSEIESSPPDLIYQRYSRFTWAGVESSLSTGRPLFLEYNGSEVWVGRHWDDAGMFKVLARVERLNLAAAARVFVVSEVERQNLLKAGVAQDKIVVNPNGVDTEKFRPCVGGEAERRRLGIADDEILVGFVSTFGPWHGVTTLAEAIAMMPSDARLRFLLVGEGKLREQVERILRDAGALQRVIFTGQVAHERVPSLLDACDQLVAPHVPLADGSPFFGSPTKLFEYMAVGKAIVASRLGQIAEVLTHEKNALLVEPSDARQLSEAIMRLAQDRNLRERLGDAARRAAIESHTWEYNAARVLDAYRSFMEQK